MKERLIVAAVCVPLLFVVLFFLPPIVLSLIIAVVAGIGAFEFLKTAGGVKNIGFLFCSILAAVLIPLWAHFDGSYAMLFTGLFLYIVIIFFYAVADGSSENRLGLVQIAGAVFSAFIVPIFLSCLVTIKQNDYGQYYVLIPFLAAFISDGGGLFAGMAFGRKKLAPRISPNKTVEGAVGGLLAAVLFLLLYGLILRYAVGFAVNFPVLALYGVTGSIVSQLGDLSFSLIKREYKIKDYGNILPGHGGVLDRFDSVIFCSPLIFILLTWIPAFTR